jgi:folate-dependent phosphoribosylglycinamide formyltransferase PurN
MKKVFIIAPIDSSAFAACLVLRTAALPGVKVVGVLVRSISLDRAVKEWRRDGFRLLQKVWTNHILRGRKKVGSFLYPTARQQLDQMGYPREGLSQLCQKLEIPIFHSDDLNSAPAVNFVKSLQPTLAIFAGGGMIRESLMQACGDGILNCHMGPLPRYRGMDVVEWPFLEESYSARTAVTVHFMDQGLDTGPIIEVADIPRAGCQTITDLRSAAEGLKVEALLRAVIAHRDGTLKSKPQAVNEGRQYFVLHPTLTQIANQRAQIALSKASQ